MKRKITEKKEKRSWAMESLTEITWFLFSFLN